MDRQTQVSNACVDERDRFNNVLLTKELFIDSPEQLNHGHRVLSMRPDFWLVTQSPGSNHTSSWAYCNDGRWSKLLKSAGVHREPASRAVSVLRE